MEQYKKKTIGMAFASVGAALLNYGLNAYFIPIYGYNAAAYTTLAGYMFLLAIHMLLVKRLKLSDVFDNRYILLLVGGMMLLTIGINIVYSNSIVRYIIIAIFLCALTAFAFKKKMLVKSMIQRIIK